MRATYTAEQAEIERTMLELGAGGLEQARHALERGWGAPDGDAELLEGFGGLGLSEEQGGFGSSLLDAAIAVEALARTLVPTRLPVHLAAVLTAAAAGIDVDAALTRGECWSLAADADPAGGTTLVAYGADCDAVVLWNGDGVSLVDPAGLQPRESVDPTRPASALPVGGSVRQAGDHGDALRRAVVLAAADLCGVANGAVALGAQYAADREQFGRSIGSFQGVAFQLAEAFVAARAAWDLTVYAAWAVEVGEPTAAGHVHAAKAKAGQAALFAAERVLQVHGGIGMTMGADPHLFLRRALFDDAWLGSGREHRLELGRLRVDAAA